MSELYHTPLSGTFVAHYVQHETPNDPHSRLVAARHVRVRATTIAQANTKATRHCLPGERITGVRPADNRDKQPWVD